MEITPVKDFILMQLPVNAENKIIRIPGSEERGVDVSSLVVIKTGKECKLVKIGDRVVTDVNAVAPVKIEGKQYFITKEFNVGLIIR